VFVTKFAQMLLEARPTSTAKDIDENFSSQLPCNAFSQVDVTEARRDLRKLVDR
jgi:hypothetical protein